jgi:CBS domain-containing protein
MTTHKAHLQGSIAPFVQPNVATVDAAASIPDVARTLEEHRCSSVPVLEGGAILGVLSQTDLLRQGRRDSAGHGAPLAPLAGHNAGELATKPAVVVPSDARLSDVAALLVEQRIHRVFVVDDGRLQGVFSTLDLMRAIGQQKLATPIEDVMSKPAFTISVSATLAHATDRLASAHVSGVCVVDDEGWPVGLFSQREALRAAELPGETPLEDVMSYALVCLHGKVPLHRASTLAAESRARRVLVIEHRHVVGVVTPLDFARAASG